MQFNWDSGNIEHIALHDVTPQEAEEVIENDPLEIGKVERNGELRIVHVGETYAGRVLLVAITYRTDLVRVVTAYPVSKKVRKFYEEERANAMNDTLKTPDFGSEKEEAEWYDTHEDDILAQFEQAAKDGTLGRGTLVRRSQTAATSIRLNSSDIEMAKALAEKRGIGYQTYLKMIIHQHLLREINSLALSSRS